ncbi:MAG: PHP domain-containing protein [Oscillospiraceae bacterium]|nr:PHP domain-containing protein [Oscillospiraceae bacterium]
MFLYETHLHTAPVSACAAASPVEQVRAYKAGGYTGIIVTDHFINGNSGCPRDWPWAEKMAFFCSGYELAKKEGDLCGLDVFFGFEFSVSGQEFLTYGLSPDFLLANTDMDKLSVARFSALVRANGGYLAQAHPFREAFWIRNPGPVEPRLMDGVEVYNAGMPDEVNRKALEFARLHGLPMQAGSDCHDTGIPFVSGIALRDKANSIFDIIDAIKANTAELIRP